MTTKLITIPKVEDLLYANTTYKYALQVLPLADYSNVTVSCNNSNLQCEIAESLVTIDQVGQAIDTGATINKVCNLNQKYEDYDLTLIHYSNKLQIIDNKASGMFLAELAETYTDVTVFLDTIIAVTGTTVKQFKFDPATKVFTLLDSITIPFTAASVVANSKAIYVVGQYDIMRIVLKPALSMAQHLKFTDSISAFAISEKLATLMTFDSSTNDIYVYEVQANGSIHVIYTDFDVDSVQYTSVACSNAAAICVGNSSGKIYFTDDYSTVTRRSISGFSLVNFIEKSFFAFTDGSSTLSIYYVDSDTTTNVKTYAGSFFTGKTEYFTLAFSVFVASSYYIYTISDTFLQQYLYIEVNGKEPLFDTIKLLSGSIELATIQLAFSIVDEGLFSLSNFQVSEIIKESIYSQYKE